jgi:hypothetical protein
MDDHGFRAQKVNRWMFHRVKNHFEKLQLVQVLPGKPVGIASEGRSNSLSSTCFRASKALIDLARSYGIDAASACEHFNCESGLAHGRSGVLKE